MMERTKSQEGPARRTDAIVVGSLRRRTLSHDEALLVRNAEALVRRYGHSPDSSKERKPQPNNPINLLNLEVIS